MFFYGIKQRQNNIKWLERWFDDNFWEKKIIDKPSDSYDYNRNFYKFIDWIIKEKPGFYTSLIEKYQVSSFKC